MAAGCVCRALPTFRRGCRCAPAPCPEVLPCPWVALDAAAAALWGPFAVGWWGTYLDTGAHDRGGWVCPLDCSVVRS